MLYGQRSFGVRRISTQLPNFDFKKDITLAFLNLGASTKYWLSWRAQNNGKQIEMLGLKIGIKWEICCQIHPITDQQKPAYNFPAVQIELVANPL